MQMKEIIDKIADRDTKKGRMFVKDIVVEHSKIDFQYMIISRKL